MPCHLPTFASARHTCHSATLCTLCRQQIAASVKEQYVSFGRWLAPHQLPIVYNDVYNVSFMGIENLHVFDSKKFRKVIASLEREQLLKRNQVGIGVGLPSHHTVNRS